MKRKYVISILLIALFSVCGNAFFIVRGAEASKISHYTNIPGITAEEIDEIEKLKAKGAEFRYGHISETESFMLADGSYDGFVYSLCEELTELFGIKFTPVPFVQWSDMIDNFESKEIDFIGDLTQTQERMQRYYMSHTIAERSLRLYTLVDAPDIIKEADLIGMKIGKLSDTISIDYIENTYDLDLDTVEFLRFDDAAEMLRRGEIDAFVLEGVADPSFLSYDFIKSKEFFKFVYSPVSMSTANPELQAVITIMNKYLAAGGIDVLYDLYKEGDAKYAQYKLHYSLTDEEREYINSVAEGKNVIPIGLEHDNYPYCFYNTKEQEFQGIAVDVLREIGQMTGLDFLTVTANDTPWSEIMGKLRSGELSLVSQLVHTDMRKNDFLWSDVPYATSYFSLVSKDVMPNLAVYQVIRTKAGYVSKTVYEEMFFEWFPDHGNARAYDTQDDAFSALESGEIDLLLTTEDMLLVQSNYRENPGFKVNISFETPVYSYFGFNKNESVLRDIINKTQQYIDTASIEKHWTSRTFDYSVKLANQRTLFIGIFSAGLLCVLLGVIYLAIKNASLTKKLARETAVLSTVYDSLPDAVFSTDNDNVYTSCNPSFSRLAGIEADVIIGKKLSDECGGSEVAESFLNGGVKDCGDMQAKEITIQLPNGDTRTMETIKAPLVQNGLNIGLLGIIRDITARKNAEETARAAIEARGVFLAHMSHEIRTPINAIAGMLDIAGRTDEIEKKDEALARIRAASRHLLGIVNNILDVSKIESGKLELLNAPFKLIESLGEVRDIIKISGSEKEIDLVFDTGGMAEKTIIGDKLRLNQVLINLLSNAVKFTRPNGRVELAVRPVSKTDKNLKLRFSVTDDGIGMSKEHLSRLFRPFEQGDNTIAARYGGTGLGLIISRSIVRMMGSDITVKSEPNVGTEFSFNVTFPICTDNDESAVESLTGLKLEGKRIMLAEDVEINRIIMREMLADTGAELVEVSDGKAALWLFENSPVGFYDIIFMDIQMPEMDGYEATEAIRGLDRDDAKSTPIIAMTANVYLEDEQRAIMSGMNGHLTKPFDYPAILDVIMSFVKKTI